MPKFLFVLFVFTQSTAFADLLVSGTVVHQKTNQNEIVLQSNGEVECRFDRTKLPKKYLAAVTNSSEKSQTLISLPTKYAKGCNRINITSKKGSHT